MSDSEVIVIEPAPLPPKQPDPPEISERQSLCCLINPAASEDYNTHFNFQRVFIGKYLKCYICKLRVCRGCLFIKGPYVYHFSCVHGKIFNE